MNVREPKTVVVGERSFTLLPIKARLSGELGRKFAKITLPLLGTIKELMTSLDFGEKGFDLQTLLKGDLMQSVTKLLTRVDMQTVVACLQDALDALPPHEFDALLLAMMAHVQCHIEGTGTVTLVTGKLVDDCFDNPMDMYRVMYEVALFNKFPPFGLVAGGSVTSQTAG